MLSRDLCAHAGFEVVVLTPVTCSPDQDLKGKHEALAKYMRAT